MKDSAMGSISPRIVRPLRLIAVLPVIVAMVGSGATRADDPPVQGRAVLEFRVLATGRGHATWPIGSMLHGDIGEGVESGPWHMQLRFSPPGDGSECGGTVVNIGVAPNSFAGPDPAFLAWDVTGTVRRAETDKIEIEYAWERRTRPGSGQEPRSGRDQVTLKEDERVLLDFVPIPSAEVAAACYHHVAIELAASIRQDPIEADRRIAYDLWLISEDQGKRATRRLRLIGKQGEKVPFDYGTLRSKLEGIPVSEEGSDVIETEVNGHIRGRVQPNGTVEVALLAERGVRPSHRHWATGEKGEKVVRAAAGETVKLELPPPSGLSVNVKDASTLHAIAQHQISLVLRTTPME